MNLTKDIFNITTEEAFKTQALNVFKFQYENNSVYRSFCDLLYKNPSDVNQLHQIPFLPIQFFKSREVLSSKAPTEITFSSSGTTGQITSKHHVTDLKIYKDSFKKGFSHFYGNVEEFTILALLPNYLDLTLTANFACGSYLHCTETNVFQTMYQISSTISSLELDLVATADQYTCTRRISTVDTFIYLFFE